MFAGHCGAGRRKTWVDRFDPRYWFCVRDWRAHLALNDHRLGRHDSHIGIIGSFDRAPERRDDIDLTESFRFIKGCLLIRISIDRLMPEDEDIRASDPTLLFDIEDDPQQLRPPNDRSRDQQMRVNLVRGMRDTNAPQEQFERLGIDIAPQSPIVDDAEQEYRVADVDDDIPFLIGEDFTSRRNVTWRVEQADRDPTHPLLEPQMPWDDGHPFLHGTVLLDPSDAVWKAWGTASTNDSFSDQWRRLAYLESDDGVHWRRPELDLHPFNDHARTNIVMDMDSGGNSLCSSVLIDPDAGEADRLLMFVLRKTGRPGGAEWPDAVCGFAGADGKASFTKGLYRYRSGDGIHWRPEVGPVMGMDNDPRKQSSTSDNIFVYRNADGSFTAYHKTTLRNFPGSMLPYEIGAGICRVLVRRCSADGITWSDAEQVILPDWRDTHDTQFMEMSVTPAAGGYVGVLTVYKTANQTIELQFAASRDGRHWWRPDRRTCVAQPALGDYGGGMMWGSHHMIPDGNRVHYYFAGFAGIHGDVLSTEEAEVAAATGRAHRPLPELHGEVISRTPSILSFQGALCRATWKRGRLWGLTTASGGRQEGTAVTSSAMRPGHQLLINACTSADGSVTVELVDKHDNPLPGFDRNTCQQFQGDSDLAEVVWKGNPAPPRGGARARFILQNARLYGFEFR